jgi:hypothetical protein
LSEQNLKDLINGSDIIRNDVEFEQTDITSIKELMQTWNFPTKRVPHDFKFGLNSKYIRMIGEFFECIYVTKYRHFVCLSYEMDTTTNCYKFWTEEKHDTIISLFFYLYPCVI